MTSIKTQLLEQNAQYVRKGVPKLGFGVRIDSMCLSIMCLFPFKRNSSRQSALKAQHTVNLPDTTIVGSDP